MYTCCLSRICVCMQAHMRTCRCAGDQTLSGHFTLIPKCQEDSKNSLQKVYMFCYLRFKYSANKMFYIKFYITWLIWDGEIWHT